MAAQVGASVGWRKLLNDKREKEGSWASTMWEKEINELDQLHCMGPENMKMEVMIKARDAAMLVAEPGNKVRFLHHMTVIKFHP